MQGKAKQKGGAKAAGQEGGDAWEAAPGKLLRLRVKDVRNTLKERWLQLFWPEDGRWWPGQVLDIRCKERKVHLMYKTGACPSAYALTRKAVFYRSQEVDWTVSPFTPSWESTTRWLYVLFRSSIALNARTLPLAITNRDCKLRVHCLQGKRRLIWTWASS